MTTCTCQILDGSAVCQLAIPPVPTIRFERRRAVSVWIVSGWLDPARDRSDRRGLVEAGRLGPIEMKDPKSVQPTSLCFGDGAAGERRPLNIGSTSQ